MGWLTNPLRRERRDKPQTLTDTDVLNLIKRIDQFEKYTKLEPEEDKLVRMRDKSLIAMLWTFFKRGSEVLNLKFNDVMVTENELLVTFRILKKKGNVIVTKRKNLAYPFCQYIQEWVVTANPPIQKSEAYLYPPYKLFGGFCWNKHLTIQRLDQILQRIDPTITSHIFRYGHAEKLLTLGYTPWELKQVGDWATSRIPEMYAERKGLTKSLRQFAEDLRIL